MTYGKLVACALAAMGLVSIPRPASAIDRLTNDDVKKLFDTIEHNRSEFEASLDDKQKNSIIKGSGGEVNANEFLDDFEDQVQRARDRFKDDYSASSEVLTILQYGVRLQGWVAMQPAGFPGTKTWGVLDSDLRRLATAYNTTFPKPGQQGLGTVAQARRINDDELKTAVDNINKKMDGFRTAYNQALEANASLTPQARQTSIQQVDTMKKDAQALHTALDKKQKGIPEAGALLKQSALIIDTTSKLPPSSPATLAWTPMREDLAKVALGYEVPAPK